MEEVFIPNSSPCRALSKTCGHPARGSYAARALSKPFCLTLCGANLTLDLTLPKKHKNKNLFHRIFKNKKWGEGGN